MARTKFEDAAHQDGDILYASDINDIEDGILYNQHRLDDLADLLSIQEDGCLYYETAYTDTH